MIQKSEKLIDLGKVHKKRSERCIKGFCEDFQKEDKNIKDLVEEE